MIEEDKPSFGLAWVTRCGLRGRGMSGSAQVKPTVKGGIVAQNGPKPDDLSLNGRIRRILGKTKDLRDASADIPFYPVPVGQTCLLVAESRELVRLNHRRNQKVLQSLVNLSCAKAPMSVRSPHSKHALSEVAAISRPTANHTARKQKTTSTQNR